MQESGGSQRKVHIDLLRILACFCVVMLHVSAQYWYYLPVKSVNWVACNTYDALVSFGVPMFVMVSGMLFLGREGEIDIKRLYRGNILRLAVVYCVWSFLYSLWGQKDCFGTADFSWADVLNDFIEGKYHLWFIPMLMGIYMITPCLKTWVKHAEKKQIEYFLLAFIILRVGVDTLKIFDLPVLLECAVDKIDVPLACSFVGYFVLGFYLDKYMPEKKVRRIIYGAGVVGLVGAVCVSARVSMYYNEPHAEAFGNFSVFILLVSVAIFIFFKDKVANHSFSETSKKWIGKISADTLGIYVFHLMVAETGVTWGITAAQIGNLAITPLIGIPALSVLWFLVSMIIVALLRRIPIIGKYIC